MFLQLLFDITLVKKPQFHVKDLQSTTPLLPIPVLIPPTLPPTLNFCKSFAKYYPPPPPAATAPLTCFRASQSAVCPSEFLISRLSWCSSSTRTTASFLQKIALCRGVLKHRQYVLHHLCHRLTWQKVLRKGMPKSRERMQKHNTHTRLHHAGSRRVRWNKEFTLQYLHHRIIQTTVKVVESMLKHKVHITTSTPAHHTDNWQSCGGVCWNTEFTLHPHHRLFCHHPDFTLHWLDLQCVPEMRVWGHSWLDSLQVVLCDTVDNNAP